MVGGRNVDRCDMCNSNNNRCRMTENNSYPLLFMREGENIGYLESFRLEVNGGLLSLPCPHPLSSLCNDSRVERQQQHSWESYFSLSSNQRVIRKKGSLSTYNYTPFIQTSFILTSRKRSFLRCLHNLHGSMFGLGQRRSISSAHLISWCPVGQDWSPNESVRVKTEIVGRKEE